MIEFVEIDLAAQRIAVNSQSMRRAGLIAVHAIEHALDIFLLEFINRFRKQNSALDHSADQRFQLISHGSRSAGI